MGHSNEKLRDDVFNIDFPKAFTRAPAGRFRSDGQYSGEAFRKDHLLPALRAHKRLRIILDGARGYGSSFLDEAFGGLVRDEHLDAKELHSRMEIVSKKASIVREIWDYIENPYPRSAS